MYTLSLHGVIRGTSNCIFSFNKFVRLFLPNTITLVHLFWWCMWYCIDPLKQNDLYWFLPKLVTSIFTSTHKVTSDSFRERGFSNSMEQQKARHDSFTNKKPEIYGSSPGGDLTIVKLVISNIAIKVNSNSAKVSQLLLLVLYMGSFRLSFCLTSVLGVIFFFDFLLCLMYKDVL